jgi:hypothetical protein
MIRKILAATAALTLGLGGVLALPASATETNDNCKTETTGWVTEAPSGDGWKQVDQRTVTDKDAWDETVIDVEAQHYSYKGGPIEGTPATPAEDPDAWQANTTLEPHYQGGATPAQKPDGSPYVDGESGLHYTSHGNVGLADWFYFQAEESHVVHHEAVTHEEYKYSRTVCEPDEPKATVVLVDFFDPTCENTEAGLQVEYNPKQAEVTVDPEGTPQPGDTITVTFTAKDGFYIDGESEFTHTYSEVPGDCNQPPAKVTKVDDTRLSCDNGLEAKTYKTVTPYIWNGEEWVLDIDNAVTTHTDWTFVRDLNKGEKDELNCNPPKDNPPKDNPPKPEPPAAELPHTGGNTALLPWALGMLVAGVALTLLGYRRKSVV